MTNLSGRAIVFGGSFDPPHIGHVKMVETLRAQFPQNPIWVVPVFQHPVKGPSQQTAAFEHRTQMCRLAFPDCTVLDIEAHLPRPNFTVQTLQHLGHERVALCIGEDQWQSFAGWKDYEWIIKHVPILVFSRNCDPSKNKSPPNGPLWIDWEKMDISSSEIRRELQRNNFSFIPKSVKDYISKHRVYEHLQKEDPNGTN